MLRLNTLCLLATTGFLTAEWMQDLPKAKETAAAEGKDLVISFVGSDWCKECEILDRTVLSKADFQNEITDTHVLVTLDFPMGQPEISKRNEPMRVLYGVPAYPALVIADAEGKPYGLISYERDWTSANYAENINLQLRHKDERDAALKDLADATTDKDKVKALEAALTAVPEGSRNTIYKDLVDQLRTLSKDQSEVIREIIDKARLEELKTSVQDFMQAGDFASAIKRANESVNFADATLAEKQGGLAFRYYCQLSTQDYDGASATAAELAKITPKTGMKMQAMQMKQRADDLLAQSKGEPQPAPQSAEPAEISVNASKRTGEGSTARTETKPATTSKTAPNAGASAEDAHQQTLLDLEKTHHTLAAAQAELDAARLKVDELTAKVTHLEKVHLAAHANEEKARKAKEAQASPQENAPATSTEKSETPAANSQIDAIEKEANDLQERARQLREKAQQLQKEEAP